MPALQNTPDTECRGGVHCSDEDFQDAVFEVRKVWDAAPEWLQSHCKSQNTLTTFYGCMVEYTVTWLNFYPHAKAPWLTLAEK